LILCSVASLRVALTIAVAIWHADRRAAMPTGASDALRPLLAGAREWPTRLGGDDDY
jgi:hypothetical protein